ncbi:MAG: lysophospholipid acyltransferase family protein [Anaerolineae bacterium]
MEAQLYALGHHVIRTYTQHILQMDLDILDPLPAGPKILAANHPTTTDPFYLLALSRQPMRLLVTEMAFKAPLFGDYLRGAGHIEVRRENERAAYEAALAALRAGETGGIFPEGALSPSVDEMGRARTGTVRMALEAGVPIVPVGIHVDRRHVLTVETTIKDMTEAARWLPLGTYAMTVGRAVTLTGHVEDRDYVRQQSVALMQRIRRLAHVGARRVHAAAAFTEAIPGHYR